MLEKIKIKKRKNNMYPYSIMLMGQEQVLISEQELFDLYDQITDILIDNENYWENHYG